MDSRDLPMPRIPVSTYRLQFNHSFTFRDAAKIIPYLYELGVTDLYASPYFKAKAGSLHGYDITDYNALNPEIGSEQDCAAMIAELMRRGMGQVLDIVPNHMCVECPENSWWTDVLENGPSSVHARFFDIDWAPVKKELKDKVLLPILGDQYGNILENQELRLSFEEGAFFVHYHEHRFPIRPQTCMLILEHRLEKLQAVLPAETPDYAEFLSINTALRNLPPYTETDPYAIEERYREKEVIKRRLFALFTRSPGVRAHIVENLRLYNGVKGDPRSFDLLDGLMNQQVYRLSHWRVATDEINYRRFFDINGLAAIRMENHAVFHASHDLVFRLVKGGGVTGLRVDHPDGLYNPAEYFHRLQRGCFLQRMTARERGGEGGGPAPEPSAEDRPASVLHYDALVLEDPDYKPFYIVGEKILTKGERMPEDWPVFSTTGYVFINSVNGVFIDGSSAKAFDSIYQKFTGEKVNVADVIYEKKKLVEKVAMSSEVNTLAHYLNGLSEKNRHTRDFTLNSLQSAITEVIAAFPVYRTYVNTWMVGDRDRQEVELAIAKAKRRSPAVSESVFDFLKDVLLLRFPPAFGYEDKAEWLDFVMRFQQITGPVMAKGVEDTAFYVYNRFVSLNEVGGTPDRFGTPLETFHGQNIERMKYWAHALIATSTHDTKRSEHVRARINVLSGLPREWGEKVRAWARLNRKKKTVLEGREAPDRNEEYLLYQTLIGAWPVEPLAGEAYGAFTSRIRDYMRKASREAKVNTSWINPDKTYEDALAAFIDAVLSPSPGNRFLNDFLPFQRMISDFGMYNSLSQTLLKICSPGVPDFYQGTELWDFSLVDPDNRRLVDFEKRVAMLAELKRREAELTGAELARDLWANKDDGRIMLYLIYKALTFRKGNRALFEQGEYVPLAGEGPMAGNICAFERRTPKGSAIAAVPRLMTQAVAAGASPGFGTGVWDNTSLVLSGAEPGTQYRNVFTGAALAAEALPDGRTGLPVSGVFADFPVALLASL